MDGRPKSEEIKCWGCNRVTAECPRKVGLPSSVLSVLYSSFVAELLDERQSDESGELCVND